MSSLSWIWLLGFCNATDMDCKHPCTANDRSGEICEGGLCVPGCREDVPEITSKDGLL
jgi:hypothetical protein